MILITATSGNVIAFEWTLNLPKSALACRIVIWLFEVSHKRFGIALDVVFFILVVKINEVAAISHGQISVERTHNAEFLVMSMIWVLLEPVDMDQGSW
jgi:hypothetical protein